MATDINGRQWAIIGVVSHTFGGGESDTTGVLDLAKEIGRIITRNGSAVLTGGHHNCPEQSVKYKALLGAAKASQDTTPARLIGIVPRGIPDKLSEAKYSFETCVPRPPSPGDPFVECGREAGGGPRYLYGHTRLKSKQRNEITGPAGDALIALKPGPLSTNNALSGTAQEVKWAFTEGRPVVFLNSWGDFQAQLANYFEQLSARDHWRWIAPNAEKAVEIALNAIEEIGLKGNIAVVRHHRDKQKGIRFKGDYDPALTSL